MHTSVSPTLHLPGMHLADLGRLLIVDDEVELMTALCETLSPRGYKAAGFTSGKAALEALQAQEFDVLLTDLMMPDMDGIALLRAALDIDPHLVGIIMTGQGTVQTAVEAMKVGAFDYVMKPFRLQVLLPVLARALDVRRLRMDNVQLRETVAMYELSQTIAHALDARTILHKVADAVWQQCDADGVSIMLPTEEGDELYIAVMRGKGREHLLGERVPFDEGIAGWVARHQEPVLLHGAVEDPRFRPRTPHADIRSAMSIPMLSGGHLVGVLNVSTTQPRRFSLGQLKVLSLIANSGSSALEAAMLYEAVQQAEAKYRAIFENAIEGIFQTTPEGGFLTVNPALARILGYAGPEELKATITSMKDQLYVDPEHHVEFMRRLEEDGLVQGFECQLSRKDESVSWVSISARAVHGAQDASRYYEGTMEDITERKRAEAELARQRDFLHQHEKLSAMGELLAGVAHELNNPLSVVLGQAALLRQTATEGPQAARAEKIAQAADRCARIVKNFLALARQHPPERHEVRLNQIVQEAVELLAYPLRVDSVEVYLELAEELPLLWADPHQLHQVVVNLVTNAHHAMRGSESPCRLTLTTCSDPTRGRVYLIVTDTGPGIPPEIQARIFEPFFTTKPPGQGTGLGLSICQGIIEGHGGTLRVESAPGVGTIFDIELPVGVPPVVKPAEGPAKMLASTHGEAILVVDDEPEIAGLLAEMLAADGHVVETAENGALALAKLQERPYGLILSDLRMPELDGPGLYRELERSHPDLVGRIIFLTGDTLTPDSLVFVERVGAPTIGKPFALEEVRQVVQRVLQAHP